MQCIAEVWVQERLQKGLLETIQGQSTRHLALQAAKTQILRNGATNKGNIRCLVEKVKN